MIEVQAAAPESKQWSEESGVYREEPDSRYHVIKEGYADDDEDEDEDEDDYASSQDSEDIYTEGLSEQDFRAKLKDMNNRLDSEILDPEERDEVFDWFHSLASPESAPPFLREYGLQDRNVLYRIATDRTIKINHDWLVERLVEDERSADLLKQVPLNERRNALFHAINNDKQDFIYAVVHSKADRKILEDAISSQSWQHETAIHVAISQNLQSDLTVELIKKASKDTFGCQNDRGLTPLHLAVEYKRCTSSRFKVVQALIEYGDIAFDRFTKEGDSIYQWHVESRPKQHQKPKNMPISSKTKRMGGDVPNGTKKEIKFDSLPSESKPIKPDPKHINKDKAQYVGEGLTLLHEVSKTPDHSTTSTNVSVLSRDPLQARKGFTADNTGITFAASPQKSDIASSREQKSSARPKRPNKKQLGVQSSKGPSTSSREAPDIAIADKIAQELKLHYLRSTFRDEYHVENQRNHDSAVKFLYGENVHDIQLCFNFPAKVREKSEKINFEDFNASYGRLKFDKVLHYVDFRDFELELASRPRNNKLGAGKRDMNPFFKWLWDKGVRNIIKVCVEDRYREVPHSDEAIEEALGRFNIEILDWRKPDLDPLAIQNACKSSQLREVHLSWNGNNAVLRSWSEPEGLRQLRSLTTVHLHEYERGLDSRERTMSNIEGFKRRLEPIFVHHVESNQSSQKKSKGSNLPTATRRGTQMDPHSWLKTMDKFADGIYALEPPRDFPSDYLTNPQLPEQLREGVKVALIDDGVDFMSRSIAEKLEGGRSFDIASDEDPFHGSTTGHGTLMAYMIARVCPKVRIFVGKLNMVCHSDGKQASFTAKSAAQAVNFAVNRKYDIISMSWTIRRPDDGSNRKDLDDLQEALENAARNHIIVFCSAPDIGQSDLNTLDSYYPFSYKPVSHRIFKIGAANANGSIYPWVGSPDNVDYILPGHDVAIREGDRISAEDDVPKTGSSVATALAAGLAALLVHCVRLGAIYNHYRGKGNDKLAVGTHSVQTIKRFDGMKEAFHTIASFRRNGNDQNLLKVESYFENLIEVLSKNNTSSNDNTDGKDTDPNDEKWVKLTDVARDLVTGITQSKVNGKIQQNHA